MTSYTKKAILGRASHLPCNCFTAHPAFAHFLDDLIGTHTIPDDIIWTTTRYMKASSAVYASEDKRRALLLTQILDNILCVDTQSLDDDTDGGVGSLGPLFILLQRKRNELGEGGLDISTQAGLSYVRSWAQPKFEKVRDATNWPTFVLVTSGPILGAVFTDGLIVQRLTDYIWDGIDSALSEIHIARIARIFYALKKGLENLRSFYEAVELSSSPTPTRYFPSISALITWPGGARSLQLEVPWLSGKWSRLHNISCTDALYTSQGYRCQICPALRRKGTPPAGQLKFGARTSILRIATPRREGADIRFTFYGRDGVCRRPDLSRIEGEERRKGTGPKTASGSPRSVTSQRIGDLRPPNVMITTATRDVKIIDFDWAGEEGEVKYPCLISLGLKKA